MNNLVLNPAFLFGLECWGVNSNLNYEIGENSWLTVSFNGRINNPNLSIVSQSISLESGWYYFKAEIDTESSFGIEICDADTNTTIKTVSCRNGCIDSIEFNFDIASNTKIEAKICFLKSRVTNRIQIKYLCIHRNGETSSPYLNAPPKTFWSGAVAGKSYFDLEQLTNHHGILQSDYKYATAGSCFAQHISRYLKQNGLNCLNLEPAPEDLSAEEANAFGFNHFSCRYGNIYTTRQLYQLFLESEGRLSHPDDIWCKAGRYYDALRPSVDPVGYSRPEYVKEQRTIHLQKVSELWRSFDVFVFTLGLTECWASREFGTVYPTAPGTIAGCFESSKYEFLNLSFEQVYSDLSMFWNGIKLINTSAKLLLTVSPVPLTATATEDHVLVATTHSKSILRAVAGEFTKNIPDTYYFPSFELISSHPSRGMFYNPNLRTVNKSGVDFVMRKFFADHTYSVLNTEQKQNADKPKETVSPEFEVYCDDELLDKFR